MRSVLRGFDVGFATFFFGESRGCGSHIHVRVLVARAHDTFPTTSGLRAKILLFKPRVVRAGAALVERCADPVRNDWDLHSARNRDNVKRRVAHVLLSQIVFLVF
jgi:hypothetical protein